MSDERTSEEVLREIAVRECGPNGDYYCFTNLLVALHKAYEAGRRAENEANEELRGIIRSLMDVIEFRTASLEAIRARLSEPGEGKK